MSLRILHTESSLNWGGQEKRICEETRWLLQHGHDSAIACPPQSEIFRHATELGLPVIPVSMRNSIDLRGYRGLRDAVKARGFQLINTHNSKDTWLSFPMHLRGLPVVRTRHITEPVRNGFGYRHTCDRVVASAECIRQMFVEQAGLPAAHVEVIGEFVDLEHFRPGLSDEGFRDRHRVLTSPLFAVVGMIRSEKGQMTFVKAALRVLRKLPHARFAIVGEGVGDRDDEHKLTAKLRRVYGANADLTRTPIFMTGFMPDVRPAMAAADVLVVPSHAEAQSRVLPEAFAMGKCCLGSNVGGIPEIITHDCNGWLAEPRDPASLASAMRLLGRRASLRERLSSHVRSYAERHFSIDGQMEKTVDLYRRVIAAKGISS